ncbi:MAG: citramalate synthase [Clostridiaceae bacterium]|nr:citramalate synthase [Clostridiaceae bacterium]
MEPYLELFDTTLRDGAQSEGISFSVSDKLAIVKTLDEFGVHYIEAGNPGSNPKDMDFFSSAASMTMKHARLVAFGSTKRKGIAVTEDANVLSLLAANTSYVAIFGKSWDLHVTEVLSTTLEENLSCVRETIKFFRKKGKEVFFDAEHFFDGYVNNPGYAMQVLAAAKDGGAALLVLCDTNGGMLPAQISRIVGTVKTRFPDMRIGIHCHNDTGCAVANSMVAVDAGACHVQGTFLGIGERCGNADLSVIVPNLQLKSGYRCINGSLEKLRETAIKIAEISNMSIPNSRPYIGESAFAHKGGMHIDGVDKISRSFEHVDPASVGNSRRFLLSEVSGKKAILLKLRDIAPGLDKNSPETAAILDRLKELEHKGYQFEAAEASFELMVKKVIGRFKPHFRLDMYKVSSEFPAPEVGMSSNAMIKIKVDGSAEMTAAVGNGPVNALDLALRKALCVFYPIISGVQLSDYKVRVLETDLTTDSRVRVLIESSDGHRKWTTVGVSTDIIEASFEALVDSLEYILSLSDTPVAE